MKRLLFILGFFISVSAYSQITYLPVNGIATPQKLRWSMTDSTQHIPAGPIPSLRGGSTRPGALFYKVTETDTVLVIWTGVVWKEVGSGSGSAIDTTSLSNRINMKADASLFTGGTTGQVLKKDSGTDYDFSWQAESVLDTTSLSSRINQKLNTSDTTAMLNPYLRKVDTTGMLNPYARKVDVIKNGLLRGNGTTVTGINLSYEYQIANDSLKPRNWVNVRDFGAVGDSVTNDREAFLAAQATGKDIYVPDGKYSLWGGVSTQLALNPGQKIFGNRHTSRLINKTNTRTITLDSASVVDNLSFEGAGRSVTQNFNTGVFAYESVPFQISNCDFYRFAGAPQQNGGGAVYLALVHTTYSGGGRVFGNYFHDNKSAVIGASRGEYVIVSNNNFDDNDTHIGMGAGNLLVNSNIIVGGTYGVRVFAGTNGAHSTISNNIINHTVYPLDIADVPYAAGMIISNNQVFYGGLKFTNSQNVTIENTKFQYIDSVHINNSSLNQMVNCWMGTQQGGAAVPFRYYNGGQPFSYIGQQRVTTATANRWIDQVLADTNYFKGATIIDNLAELKGDVIATALPTYSTGGYDVVVRNSATDKLELTTIGGGGSLPATYVIAASDEVTDLTTGLTKVTFRMPHAMTVTEVRASLTAASSSGLPEVNIKENGTTILSTNITVDVGEKTSTTATTAAVISDSALADDAEITIDIVTAGTGAKGLKITLIGTR